MVKALGLAYRARKTVTGTEFTIEGIKKSEVHLVLLASDSSDNTKKKVFDKSNYYHVPVVMDLDSDTISQALGKSGLMVVGITDKGFAKLLLDKKGSEKT